MADGIAPVGLRDLLDFDLLLEERVEATLQLRDRDRPLGLSFSLPLESLPVEDGKPLEEEMLRQAAAESASTTAPS